MATKPPPKSGPRKAATKRKKPTAKRKRAGRTKANRHAKPKMGRPHGCTPAAIALIVEARELGASWDDSAANADLSGKCVLLWRNRAKAAIEAVGEQWEGEIPANILELVDEDDRPFVDMFRQGQRAYGRGNVALLKSCALAAHGGPIYETKVVDGKKTKVQVGYVDPDARIGLKLLAMRDPEKYAVTRKLQHSGGGGGPIAVTVYMPEERDEP